MRTLCAWPIAGNLGCCSLGWHQICSWSWLVFDEGWSHSHSFEQVNHLGLFFVSKMNHTLKHCVRIVVFVQSKMWNKFVDSPAREHVSCWHVSTFKSHVCEHNHLVIMQRHIVRSHNKIWCCQNDCFKLTGCPTLQTWHSNQTLCSLHVKFDIKFVMFFRWEESFFFLKKIKNVFAVDKKKAIHMVTVSLSIQENGKSQKTKKQQHHLLCCCCSS